MRHAILGAGGVGGFVGAVLAAAGEPVLLLIRRESLAAHPATLRLESPLGNLEAPVTLAATLEQPVDVLWVTTKATQLEAALAAVPDATQTNHVVPLLNGIDHVARLRRQFGAERVIPATIAAELERSGPGRIVHRSSFVRFGFAASGREVLTRPAEQLVAFGCTASFEPDERTLLWRKLVLLAPMALNTTAVGRNVGGLRADPVLARRFEAAVREACAVAVAEGARIDAEQTLTLLKSFADSLRSSMQKDVEAGRPPELDAIGGPILRGAARHAIAVPVTSELVEMIKRVTRSA
jgi:2-dehydropantoate 2-reductase